MLSGPWTPEPRHLGTGFPDWAQIPIAIWCVPDWQVFQIDVWYENDPCQIASNSRLVVDSRLRCNPDCLFGRLLPDWATCPIEPHSQIEVISRLWGISQITLGSRLPYFARSSGNCDVLQRKQHPMPDWPQFQIGALVAESMVFACSGLGPSMPDWPLPDWLMFL